MYRPRGRDDNPHDGNRGGGRSVPCTLSELPELLDTKPVRSELTYMLVRLDQEYADRGPAERWEDYYADALVEHFKAS